jgi:hypothetical protein
MCSNGAHHAEHGARGVQVAPMSEPTEGGEPHDDLDPGFAPGTGTPEPGGMNPADLLRAVRAIVLETPVVGVDVVEVSPPYDDNAETTVNAAHRVVLETLGALAHKKRELAGGSVTRPGTRPDPAILRHPTEPSTWSRPEGTGHTYDDAG